MAAIAGVFCRNGAPVSKTFIQTQSKLLAHRGPGGESIWVDGPVGFAHRCRRSLAQDNHPQQPVRDRTGRYLIVCSGTVYNYIELSEDLDLDLNGIQAAEVLLNVFTRWGIEGFARCNGAFACAIWDAEERRLVLVRDPLGLHPIVYWLLSDLLVFATEPKGVIHHPAYSKEPDEIMIADYLSFNRYRFQNGRTFYKNVSTLLPGRALVVTPDHATTTRYWQLDPHKHVEYGSDEECVSAVRALMLDAVRLRLPASNKFGAALSGGFDSSSVVSMMGEINRNERDGKASIDTFSFEFGSDDADEPEMIDTVASSVGVCHHSANVLTPDFFDDMEEMLRINDGPVIESATLLLLKKKRKVHEVGIDVFLSGLGGDELFMGRLNYFSDLLRSGRWRSLWRELRGAYPYDYSTGKRVTLEFILRAYILAPLEPRWLKSFRKVQVSRSFPPPWINRSLAERAGLAGFLPRPEPPFFPSKYMQDCYEVFYYELLGAAVPYNDGTSAHFAIDTRFPMLDLRLVETLFALPRRWKISRGRVRNLQRRAMEPFVPRKVLADHLKKDFHPALDRYLRQLYPKMLGPLFEAKSRRSAEYVNWEAVRDSYDAYLAGKAKPNPLWAALNLEYWLREAF